MQNQFERISEALYWLVEHQSEQPELGTLASHLDWSPAHLQRTFQAFVGISPKQFLKHLTRSAAVARLQEGRSVFDTALDCGLSGPGRLHDLLITTLAVTPGETRRRGLGVRLEAGVGPTPFGPTLVAWTDRGITFLGFTQDCGDAAALEQLREQWPLADIEINHPAAAGQLQEIFATSRSRPLRVWLHGSPFQLKVWEALLRIPSGLHCSYGQVAAAIGQPRASRAVGSAIGSNPVAWLIPCHRVIAGMGTLGGYRWGLPAKSAMIAVEAARAASSASA